jgi:hypothetical protein
MEPSLPTRLGGWIGMDWAFPRREKERKMQAIRTSEG